MGKNILQIKTGHRKKKNRTRTKAWGRSEQANERRRRRVTKKNEKGGGGEITKERKKRKAISTEEKKTNLAASQHFVPRDHQETVPSFSGPPPSLPTFLPTYPPFWRFTVLHSPPIFCEDFARTRARASFAKSKFAPNGYRLSSDPPYATFTARSIILYIPFAPSPPCSETTGAACERNKRLSNCLESLFIGHVANWCVFFSFYFILLWKAGEIFRVRGSSID